MVHFKINFNFIADDFSIAGRRLKIFIGVLSRALSLSIFILFHHAAYAPRRSFLLNRINFLLMRRVKQTKRKFYHEAIFSNHSSPIRKNLGFISVTTPTSAVR